MAGIESLLRGRVLGERYRVEEVIGRGGMGAVYRATDERLGRPVAVKVITAVTVDAESRERMRARFRREAAAAAGLPHHPNVVPVYDYGTDPDTSLDYIVMELLRGRDLATQLQRSGPPPLALALRILVQAARGLNVGHRKGLIHRDVKPGNIFLVEDGDPGEVQVRVLDFGIAKVIDEEDTQTALTRDGRAPLSPAYASPEQLRGDDALAPSADVFSLGAVGYQLLTGQKPYTEADRNRMSVGMPVPAPSIRSRNPAIPAEVETVILRALEHDPAARFPNAGAFADAVEAALRRLEGTSAANAVPSVAGPIVASDEDDDRTALAGDEGTMVAPRPGAGAAGVAGAAMAGAAAGSRPLTPAPMGVPPRTGPAIPPPRRRVQPEPRTGTPPIVWVLLVLALAAAGAAIWYAMSTRGAEDRNDRPLAGLPDSAQKDTTRDSLTVADAPRVDQQGRTLLQQGQFAQAADLFRQAMELDPARADYKDHLAFALIKQGQPAEAATLLEDAIRLDRNYDLAYSHLGDARLALGDTMGAVIAFTRFRDITVNQRDRAIAEQKIAELTAPRPAPVPVDTTTAQPADTAAPAPAPPSAPADTVRISPPR
ncbi:protein kinase domain-containing protein [Longimicrobium sp.]|uniref:protein kinase domain-containing protein n=1 Tax=Longimicrobium sp. TaxID=2029185 RepID=UPI002CE4AAD3|nr:protein kinase [Longimicrobium sp.]HSU17059.1 protein kinase [Longimicrobium sp.]